MYIFRKPWSEYPLLMLMI